MGTHEFAWVREADLLDNFDPEQDPNEVNDDSSKKRSSRAVAVSAEQFKGAIEECRWALNEFERQVNDPCGDSIDVELEDNVTISFRSLSQPLEGGEQADMVKVGGSESDYEAEELFEKEGILDYSASGRKKAKQKAAKSWKQRNNVIKAEKLAKTKN